METLIKILILVCKIVYYIIISIVGCFVIIFIYLFAQQLLLPPYEKNIYYYKFKNKYVTRVDEIRYGKLNEIKIYNGKYSNTKKLPQSYISLYKNIDQEITCDLEFLPNNKILIYANNVNSAIKNIDTTFILIDGNRHELEYYPIVRRIFHKLIFSDGLILNGSRYYPSCTIYDDIDIENKSNLNFDNSLIMRFKVE